MGVPRRVVNSSSARSSGLAESHTFTASRMGHKNALAAALTLAE